MNLELRHPPMAPEWIDRPHQSLALGDFPLESGETIADFELVYVTHGELDASKRNAILVLPSIHGTHHRLDFLIGPGRALDPARWFVICVDAIGNGLTTSPSTSRRQPLLKFPRFGMRDIVRAQHRLVSDCFGIERLAAVIGASMGGMQALQWGVSFPHAMEAIIAMTPMARTGAWSQAVNEAYRRALMPDADWWRRDAAETDWRAWVSVQLLAGHTPESIAARFRSRIDLERWIEERAKWQAQQRSHPVDRVYQTWAYDAHDVGGGDGFGGDTRAALASIRARTLVLAPPLDLYNPETQAREDAAAIPGAVFETVPSNAGHQCTTTSREADVQFIDRRLKEFLALHCAKLST
jgi:homoserine O-acetyltransferase